MIVGEDEVNLSVILSSMLIGLVQKKHFLK